MPFNYGVKQKNGGLSRARLAQMQAEDATDLAALAEQMPDPILSQAMGQQAQRRMTEALETARKARANALRRRH